MNRGSKKEKVYVRCPKCNKKYVVETGKCIVCRCGELLCS